MEEIVSKDENIISRRDFVKTSITGVAGLTLTQCFGESSAKQLMKRDFGRLNFEVTSFGLGGQGSLMWTPEDVDPVKIILKAFSIGVNYFDTSNLYGPSQLNYGKAFTYLNLIPGNVGYNEKLRNSVFIVSKTHLRWAKGLRESNEYGNWTNGTKGSKTIDDLKRSLSQLFGDGKGNYPKGAYLNMVLLHGIQRFAEVDAVYEGLDNTSPKSENIGALAALRDYRDGSNLTGLNPKEEKLIRHIGFSGHYAPPVMMEMIQRDKDNIIDGILLPMHANDRHYFSMQHNVIPVAKAKNMGVIAMKVFCGGSMFTGKELPKGPKPVVRTIGNKELPSKSLIQYSLTTPGIDTAIMGIGEINNDPDKCQLTQNILASQILPNELSSLQRENIEKMAQKVMDGKTNSFFQKEAEPLSAPREVAIDSKKTEGGRVVKISWHTAYAGDEPLTHYEIWKDNNKIGRVEHKPQTTKEPFIFKDKLSDSLSHSYKLVSVDVIGRKAITENFII